MHFSSAFVAVAALTLGARADIDFDLDDAPRECRDICQPIDQLQQNCEVDLGADGSDLRENQLEAQCFCTNESFEVSEVSAHCHDCIRQAIEKVQGDNNNNNGGGGGGGGEDTKAIEGSECRDDDQCESGNCSDGFCRAGNAKAKVKRQGGSAIDGSDCQDDEQCRSGFCAPMEGRVNRVCQDPNGGGAGGDDDDDDDEEEEDEEDENNVGVWRGAQNDMGDILRTCSFQTTSYSPDATSLVQGITVSAAQPTNASQLTTTYMRGPTPTSDSDDDSDDGSDGEEDNSGENDSEGGNSEDDDSEGDDSEGDNSEGGNSEGDNNEGGNSEGDNSEGGNSGENDSEGGNSEGDDGEGGNSEGDNSEGGNSGENDSSEDSEGGDADSEDDSGDGDGNAAGSLTPFYLAGAIVAGAMAFI